MGLNLESQLTGDVVVIRCQGRIALGTDIDTLQAELDKQTKLRKRVVLQLAETDYIDSSGMGTLLRLSGALRSVGGDVRLCQVSPFVLRVLQATNLLSLFLTYASETEAIEAFSKGPRSPKEASAASRTKILCIDTSRDLLAYLNALLKRSGYEVTTTQHLREVTMLVTALQPRVVICGPGMLELTACDAAVAKLRRCGPALHILHLPADFSSADAGHAGSDLVNQLQSLLTT
ncbi:MAG: anti-sigma factor antagonist [Bryobacteraceae bacterium]